MVGCLGFFQRGIVFEQARIGLRGAAHVAKQRAHGRDDGGEHRNLVGHLLRIGVFVMVTTVAALLGVFQLVIVWAVNVKTVS